MKIERLIRGFSIDILRWHISARRGGQYTVWPWTHLSISRRKPLTKPPKDPLP